MRKWHVTFLAIKVLGVSNQLVSSVWISVDEFFWLKEHLLEENRRKKLLHWSKYEYFIICSLQLLSIFLARDENHDDRSVYLFIYFIYNRSIHQNFCTSSTFEKRVPCSACCINRKRANETRTFHSSSNNIRFVQTTLLIAFPFK